MLESFEAFIRHGRALADEKDMPWEMPIDDQGLMENGWNLTLIAGGLPPALYLRDLGYDDKALLVVNTRRQEQNRPPLPKQALSFHWQELIKAAACDQLLFRRNTPGHVSQNIVRPLKILATCAGDLAPWQLNIDVIHEAFSTAQKVQASGKLADLVLGAVNTVIDANHLAEACPLYPALSISRQPTNRSRSSRAVKSKAQLLDDLEQRKRAERLPERRAFWELIRIIFTEPPQSFADAMRFSVLKTMVICGLRIGEAVLLPADWKRYREYYDVSGRPAGELGGYSRALMLRHFAEKQQLEQSDSTVLFEAAQPVPEMFAEILSETLDDVLRITSPLRETLRLQVQSSRLLPWYDRNEVVPVTELYTRLTGNPFWLDIAEDVAADFVSRYRNGFEPAVLDELNNFQTTCYRGAGKSLGLNMAMYLYFHRLTRKSDAPRFRHASGTEYCEKRKSWGEVYLQIGELEDYLNSSIPTKISDTKPIKLHNGELQTWELLFLSPKRALAEGRNDGIADITRCCSVGMPETAMLGVALGEEKDNCESLFARYGATSEDRKLVLRSHALRHLQNTELFRLGVADTIITKRFNRRSVAQSYEYDHRSLAEELDSIELPPEVEASLGSKASTVARLIKSGRATGPMVSSFKRIQREDGEEAAFEFLKAESDGFHSTPYGHCINSFTVDPCPKNLECFAGCCHLTATNLPENRRHLETLEGRLKAALSEAQARPTTSIGRQNQISHATIRLDAVRKLLDSPTGERVFPHGPDLSLSNRQRSLFDD